MRKPSTSAKERTRSRLITIEFCVYISLLARARKCGGSDRGFVKSMREEEQFRRSIGKEIVRQKGGGEQGGREEEEEEKRQETLKRSQREEMTERDAL